MKKRILSLIAIAIVAATCFAVFSNGASAATFLGKDIYLKIDGIEGESKDSKHEKWIDVLDFSHASTQSVQTGSPDAAGRGVFEPFIFKHQVDRATPKLQEACMKGSHIKSAMLEVCRAIAGKQEVVYRVKLEGIKVVKAFVELEDLPEGNFQNVETVYMLVNKMTWTATAIGLDNSIGGSTEAVYDQTKKCDLTVDSTMATASMLNDTASPYVLVALGTMIVGAAASAAITAAVMKKRRQDHAQ